MELTKQELNDRLSRFIKLMDSSFPEWDTAIISSKVNQYYFMGTMQDAILLIDKNGSRNYFVRRSEKRAIDESPLKDCIHKMNSYRDAAAKLKKLGNVYTELDFMPYNMVLRLQNYFEMKTLSSLGNTLNKLRSVKSPYELHYAKLSGKMHEKLLLEAVPALLKEGMTEAEFLGQLKSKMFDYGYQGYSRFQMFQTEGDIGQVGFGENSIYPTNFDGPGGARGNSAAVPLSGDYQRRLKKGDLVFVDVAFGINGYHTDKTQVFFFGKEPDSAITNIHNLCRRIQDKTAKMMKAGAIPSQIYNDVLNSLTNSEKAGLMGYEDLCVKFLGHGVGLYIDEHPVIANGFNEPLEENMIIALEPKKGVSGVGMLGVEETYVIKQDEAKVITGGNNDIIVIK